MANDKHEARESTMPPPPEGDHPHAVEEMTESECRTRLGHHSVGRVGFAVGEHQVIIPVNFTFDGESVVFRTSSEGIGNSIPMNNVAFEIDNYDERTQSGWSVLVQGRANDVTNSLDERAEQVRTLVVKPWIGSRPMWIAITVRSITGRHINAGR